MKSDSAFSQRFKIDLIMLGILAVLCLCAVLHHFPIKLSDDDTYGAAVMPQQLGQSSVMLILPDTTANAETFPALDFSFAWYNVLSQYVGPFTIALARDIQAAQNIKAQLIVIPRRTAESFTEDQIQLTAQAVQLGATLIIEMPPPKWAPLTAVKHRTKSNSAIKRFTDAPNSPLNGKYRDQLINTPLDTQVIRIDALDSETLPSDAMLLEMDGAVAHYRRQAGAGFVYVLAFDFGQAVTALQQGRPSDALTIESEEPPRTSDLVLNEKLRAGSVPYADLLKIHVLASIMQTSPMPMLWPMPDARRSALILTHETGQLSDESFLSAENEKKRDVRSTWFVTAGKISDETLRKYHRAHFDIGAALVRPPADRIYRRYGPSFFQPFAKELNIIQQKNAIAKQISNPIASCRIAFSYWSHDYTAAFRRLAAARCQIDTSYAPCRAEEYGYLFGSGFPFLPIEKNGLPLPTYEFPTLIDDNMGLETIPKDAAVSLLKDAENTWHQPVVANFNAETMLTHPHYLAPQTWQQLLKHAQENDIWVTDVKSFMHHFTLRKQAHMHYTWRAQAHVLEAAADLPQAPFSYTAAIPKRTLSGTLHAVWLDKISLDLEAVKSTADGLLALIPVVPGEHLIQAQYQ